MYLIVVADEDERGERGPAGAITRAGAHPSSLSGTTIIDYSLSPTLCTLFFSTSLLVLL